MPGGKPGLLCDNVTRFLFLFIQQPKDLGGFSDSTTTQFSVGLGGCHTFFMPSQERPCKPGVCVEAPAGFTD